MAATLTRVEAARRLAALSATVPAPVEGDRPVTRPLLAEEAALRLAALEASLPAPDHDQEGR